MSAAPQATGAPEPPPKGIQWQTGDFTWKLGGYAEVDAIYDFSAIGSTDSFDPRTIPVGTNEGTTENFNVHARQSRINLDVSGPSSAGNFRAFVEGDFFSDQNGFRLRHAYGTIGGLLGGQTWSTFMDEGAMPETLDFESPIALPLVRTPQVRYTQDLGKGDYVAFAVEDPDSEVIPPASDPGKSETPLPDFTARLHWENERGHVQVGLFGGMARFDSDSGPSDDAFLWGVNLSTELATVGEDSAIVQITGGEGVGRYRGGQVAAPDANGNLEAIPVLGLMGSYEHHWSAKYRSSAGYSWGRGDIPSGAPADTNEVLEYAFANLIYQFTNRAWVGLEYLYGSRETFGGEKSDAHRVQFSLRFDI